MTVTNAGALPHRDFLRELAKRINPSSFLEVGVREGDSTLAVVQGASPRLTHLALCDTWGKVHGGTGRGNHDHVQAALDAAGFTGEILWLDGPSSTMIPTVDPRWFELTHVDADHSEAGALSDLRLCWRRTKRVLVAHDIFMSPVWAAASQFLSEKRDEIVHCEISVADTGTIAVWRKLC